MKKVLWICLCILVSLSGCGGSDVEQQTETDSELLQEAESSLSEEQDVYYLSVASSSDIIFPDEWECSDGSIIKIMKYPYSELGNDRELIQGCQANKISIFVGGNVTQTELIPELALLDIPYLLEDGVTDTSKMSEKLMEWFQPYYEKQGLRLLVWRMGAYNRIILQESIDDVKDFQKMKIRVMENSSRADFWTALGAEALMIPFEEIWYYLQHDKINAMDGGFWTLQEQDYELLKGFKYMMRGGFMSASTLVINLEEYEKLPPAVQEAVEELATEHLNNLPQSQYAELFATFETLELNDSVQSALIENRQVVIDNLKKDLGEDLVNDFLAYMEEIK